MVDIKIHVKVSRLLGHLERNKAAHIKSYNSALKVYFKMMAKELAKMSKDVAASKKRKDDYVIHLALPQNKSKEYDRYIKMLTMAVDELIEISTTEYNCFVNDEWEWVHHAKSISTFYNSSRMR